MVTGNRVRSLEVQAIMSHFEGRTGLQAFCCRVQLAIINGVHDRNAIAGIDQTFALVEGWAIGVS